MTEPLYNKEGAIERMRELAAARVPFVHQGRTTQGIDCVGAIVRAFEYRGPVPAYPKDPVNGELERELVRVFGPPVLVRASALAPVLDPALLEPGDIVSMQYAGPARHVALVVPHVNIPGALSVVHTDANLGHVTEHILDAKWVRRILKVWRP